MTTFTPAFNAAFGPLVPEASVASPFRWIGEYQAINQVSPRAAHAAWREAARARLRELICHLDANNWHDTVDGLDDDTVANCLARTEAVLKMAFKGEGGAE